VASPGGAISTPQQLVDALQAGQVGCFHAGTYSATEVDIGKSGITLQSYPGERATWAGRIVIAAPGVTVATLNLDGSAGPSCGAGCTLVSPTINAPNATVSSNDIQNVSGTCVIAASYGGLVPDGVVIDGNRIHNCAGAGIELSQGNGASVYNNLIYGASTSNSQGVLLYPGPSNVTFENNTIDGEGTGLVFGGYSGQATTNALVQNNIISFPSARFNVDANWSGGTPGSGNLLISNCLYTAATGYFGGSPAGSGISTAPGFSNYNIVGDPAYLNRAGNNFTPASGSRCAGKGAPTDVTTPFATPPGLFWSGDVSSGQLTTPPWTQIAQVAGSGDLSVVPDPFGGGSNVIKIAVSDNGDPTSYYTTNQYGSVYKSPNPRADLESPGLFSPGDDDYVSWRVLLPSAALAQVTQAQISQTNPGKNFFQVGEIYGPPYSGSPTLGLDVFTTPGQGSHPPQGHFGLCCTYQASSTPWFGPVLDSRWHTITYHVRFATDNTGFVEVYYDNRLQTLSDGTTRLHYPTLKRNVTWNGIPNFVDAQQYRAAGSIPGTVTIYEGTPKVGTTLASVQ